MPVESGDLPSACQNYQTQIEQVTRVPIVLDLIQLGLGVDGHTASLVPNDPVLEVTDSDIGLTSEYRGRRRMTFTRPVIQRAKRQLWLVAGEQKRRIIDQILSNDPSIPASHVLGANATMLTDQGAMPEYLI